MRRGKSYGSYRGRSGASRVLKLVAILLVVVLVVVATAVLYLGQYRVYSSDGLRLDIPFFGEKATPAPTAGPVPSPTLVIATPPPTPTPPPQFHGLALPRTALAAGAAQALIEAADGNAAWFDMKADDGSLGYVSDLALALEAGTSAADPVLNEAIKALNADPALYTVARVSCFKDDRLSNADKALNILTNSGYQWTDPDKCKWSSPTNSAVRDYVTGVCVELAALGFDEILLDNAGYPTEGNLGYIKKGPNYNLDQLDDVVGEFYAQVRAALADYPEVKLSVVTTRSALDGTDSKSGQTAENVALHAQRVWVDRTEQADCAKLLRASGWTGGDEATVALVPQAGGAGMSWAIWPEG